MANYLKHLQFRWYDPENFPTVDMMSETFGVEGLTTPQDDESDIFACDVPGNWLPSYNVSGGGSDDINANPKFPKVVRFTVVVAKDGLAESPLDVYDTLGPTEFQITEPDSDAWDVYAACVQNGGDDTMGEDCGNYLLFYNPQGEDNPWNGSIQNVTVDGYLSVAHTDLFIGGWSGGQKQSTNSIMNYQGDNENWDADYTLTSDDVTNNTLDLLSGTDFGEGGNYEAEFNVGDRVRIYGWKNTSDFNEELIEGGDNDINKLFRGEYPWSAWAGNDDWYLGAGVQGGGVDTNQYGKPVDVDGVGFHSPFFYSLWRATESDEHTQILNFAPGGSTSAVSPNNDPLNPNYKNIRDSDIFANIDSRIKYVIFQNTIGMMNEDIQGYGEYNAFVNVPADSTYENVGGPSEHDYGFIPIGGQGPNYEAGYIHNNVHVYIIFRDEWADEPIFWAQGDPRSQIRIDIDGQARLIDAGNNMFVNEW